MYLYSVFMNNFGFGALAFFITAFVSLGIYKMIKDWMPW